MANLRQERLTPGGFERSTTQRGVRRGRLWPWVAGVAAVVLVALAWFDGGEEPLHPIAQDVTLPEQAQ